MDVQQLGDDPTVRALALRLDRLQKLASSARERYEHRLEQLDVQRSHVLSLIEQSERAVEEFRSVAEEFEREAAATKAELQGPVAPEVAGTAGSARFVQLRA
jgi:oxalate decarboxylase/phosphoglucose isomerase-like protein (cupin superfamily)